MGSGMGSSKCLGMGSGKKSDTGMLAGFGYWNISGVQVRVKASVGQGFQNVNGVQTLGYQWHLGTEY